MKSERPRRDSSHGAFAISSLRIFFMRRFIPTRLTKSHGCLSCGFHLVFKGSFRRMLGKRQLRPLNNRFLRRFLDTIQIFENIVATPYFRKSGSLRTCTKPRICFIESFHDLIGFVVCHRFDRFIAGILGVLEAMAFHKTFDVRPCALPSVLSAFLRFVMFLQGIFVQIEMERLSASRHLCASFMPEEDEAKPHAALADSHAHLARRPRRPSSSSHSLLPTSSVRGGTMPHTAPLPHHHYPSPAMSLAQYGHCPTARRYALRNRRECPDHIRDVQPCPRRTQW